MTRAVLTVAERKVAEQKDAVQLICNIACFHR